MNKQASRLAVLAAFAALSACAAARPPAVAPIPVVRSSLYLRDGARHRVVPVALYRSARDRAPRPLAVLSHGYGGANTAYGFIAEALVRRGYVVASIQHVERPGDPPMASAGPDLAERRRPVWQIGADTILFVIGQLREQGVASRRSRVLLLGHSNGGDMTMLFAAEHPGLVSIALSLDNRRMPLPRVRRPHICSIRSSDQLADPGVLPGDAEAASLRMMIAPAPVKHNDLGDGATESQKQAVLTLLDACLDGSK